MTKKIFFIVGEPSGDALAAKLIKALKAQSADPIEFSGIGGDLMKAEGFKTLLPMDEICVMGLWEVAGQLPRLLRLISGVVEEIEKIQPDAVITVDLPDFNFQVALRLKKRGISKAKIIHYVAPSVWAWRPKRALKIAGFLDGLLCLLPFEPPYFTKHKLPAVFVGHPIIENGEEAGDGEKFRDMYEIPRDAPCLGLFFGSRPSEFKAVSSVLRETAQFIHEQFPGLHIIVPTLPRLEYDVLQLIADFKCPCYVVTNQAAKQDAYAACDAALAVSGTIGLELAYAGVPHVIAYKMHPLTWAIVKAAVKVKYAHLVNILLDEPAVPEYLQGKCKPDHIARGLLKLLKSPEAGGTQKQKFMKLRSVLGSDHERAPSQRAAEFVLQILKGN